MQISILSVITDKIEKIAKNVRYNLKDDDQTSHHPFLLFINNLEFF